MKLDKIDLYHQATHTAKLCAEEILWNKIRKKLYTFGSIYEAKVICRELKFYLPRYTVIQFGKKIFLMMR